MKFQLTNWQVQTITPNDLKKQRKVTTQRRTKRIPIMSRSPDIRARYRAVRIHRNDIL